MISTPASAQTTTPVLVDRDISAGAGATITIAAGEALARAEDAVVPARLFAERGISRRTANITYRLFRLAYFDLPQEGWLLVANHELFGHGARLRERFDGPIRYEVDAPAPYGDGGGATFFEFDRDPSLVERLAITTGGMEGSGVAAEQVADLALSRGRLHPRDALRYLGFELDTFSYVQGTGDGVEDPGHDVFAFLDTYNEIASLTGGSTLTARDLRRQAWVSLANPMLAYAVIGVGRYLWNGNTDMPIRALRIGGVDYLPMLRYRLTPVGTDVVIANSLGGRVRPMRVDVRFGRAPNERSWGVGLRHLRVGEWNGWTIGVGADVWRQPWVVGDEAQVETRRWGSAGRLRVEHALSTWRSGPLAPRSGQALSARRSGRLTVIGDVTLKSAGFVAGDPLGAGLVARVGVGLPLSR